MKTSKPFKTWHLVSFLVIIVLAIGAGVYGSLWRKATVKIAGQQFQVLVADNYKHFIKGLSDRKDLGNYGGMLFVFPSRTQHAMVMRDMLFSLDIVWLSGGKVIDIAPNLPRENHGVPEDQLKIYQARTDSDMVLEVPAGFMERTGLKVGDEIQVTKE